MCTVGIVQGKYNENYLWFETHFSCTDSKFRKREVFFSTGIINAHSHSRVDRFPASYSGGRRFKPRPRN
jgi:hypothetical protein